MITQEQEQEQRAIGKRCRGPHVRSVAAVVKELTAAVVANPKGDAATEGGEGWLTADVHALLSASTSTRELVTTLLENGFRAAASLCDAAARGPGCGQDVNDLIIAAGHFDGEPHEVTCPQCKTVIKYTPTNYDAEAEAE